MATTLRAQTSANVPTNDPAYEWIKILAGAGLVKTDFPEQLPWSRLEFARLIREADKNFEIAKEESNSNKSLEKYTQRLGKNRFVSEVIKALHIEFSDVLTEQKAFHLETLNRAYLQYQYLGQNPQPVFYDGLGFTSGTFHPLIDSPEGRHYLKGSNLDLQTEHWLQISPYFSLFVRPQVEVTTPSTGGDSINIYLKTLAAKTGWRNIEFEVGRDQVVWANAPHGGLLFSDNARGLDMVALDTPHPFHLPWVFKKIGLWKFATMVSNLGPEYSPQYPWMMAYQLALHITPNIRLGGNHQVTFGGKGFPMPSAGNLFLEYLGYPTQGGNPYQGGANTNREYSLFGSVRIPYLRNTEMGFELFFEDKSFTNTELLFRHEMAYRGWLWVPDLTGNARWQLWADYNYVGSIPYQHGEYTSGWALNSEFIAQTYGADTQSLRLRLGYNVSPYSKLSTNFTYIRRLSNTYNTVTTADPNYVIGHDTISSGPTEVHYLGMLGLQSNLGRGLILNVQGGIDFIQNAYFVQGNSINPGLLQVNLSWYPYLRNQ